MNSRYNSNFEELFDVLDKEIEYPNDTSNSSSDNKESDETIKKGSNNFMEFNLAKEEILMLI